MKYYVVSDVHGFYTPLMRVLQEKGFFNDSEPHKLIVCGDLFDRGKEAEELQQFILDLMKKDEVILIRGNHEDLMLDLIDDLNAGLNVQYSHHQSNGTVSTAKQLVKKGTGMMNECPDLYAGWLARTPFVKKIIPATQNYFETNNYIFVHGWIPCFIEPPPTWLGVSKFKYNPDWRNASDEDWKKARWMNGMDRAEVHKVVEPGKKIVCGHRHASYGHYRFGGACSEFEKGADFTPYFGNGVIAIDACAAHSGFINCLVLND